MHLGLCPLWHLESLRISFVFGHHNLISLFTLIIKQNVNVRSTLGRLFCYLLKASKIEHIIHGQFSYTNEFLKAWGCRQVVEGYDA